MRRSMPHSSSCSPSCQWFAASDRLDVPRDHVAAFLIPQEGLVYERQFVESFVRLCDEVEQFLSAILPT